MDGIDGGLVNGLVVLAAVADARSFGKAAERVGMTQSGVSRAIAKLETRLGARLVHRTSRAVELTDEGRALYERAAQHLAGIGEAVAETSKSREMVRGKLRVNVDPLFSSISSSARSARRRRRTASAPEAMGRDAQARKEGRSAGIRRNSTQSSGGAA